jgi:type I restriction enzyme S subunit
MGVKPGYRQTEAGQFPEQWEVDYVENLAHITTGAKNTQDRIEDGQYPFFVRSQTVERINNYSYDGEAVLTAGDGVGTGKVFHYVNGKFDLHQRVYCISDFTPHLNGYFFFLYFSNRFYSRIMQMTAKSSVDSVRREMIAKMPIPLPPKAEQEAIAKALIDADALIESLEQLVAKKRHLKQGAMQDLPSGTARLSGFKVKSGYKQTEVGMIPKDWEAANLSCLSQEPMQNGVFYKPSLKGVGVKLINVGDLYARTPIDSDALELFNASAIEQERFKVEDGDLFFTRSSVVPAGIAHCNIYRAIGSECVVFDSHVIRMRPDTKKVVPEFLFRFCVASHARHYLVSHAKTATMTTIDQQVLAKCPVLLPSVAEQEAIASVLNDMDTEIAALEANLTKARQLRQGMMQELLTGKTRLI